MRIETTVIPERFVPEQVIPAHVIPEEVIEEKYYSYEDLSPSAQENAFQKWYEGHYYMPSDDEFPAVLDDLEKAFDFSVSKYNVGWGGVYFSFNYGCGNAADINDPVRLRTWVINNWYDIIVRPKHYGEYRKTNTGKWEYQRYSKVLKEHYSLPIAGMYCEAGFMDILEDVIKGKRMFDTMDDLLQECLGAFFTAWDKERDYEQSKEFFAEECYCNALEFDEEGNIL